MRSETSYPEWVGRAPAPAFPRALLAIFVATAVGAVSGVTVVLSLLSALTAETQPGVLLTKNTVEAANSGVRQEEPQPTPRPEFNRSSVTPSADSGAIGIASQDASSNISRSQSLPARAPSANDQPPLVPRETKSNGAVTSTSDGVEHQGQTQFDRGQQHFVVHHRSYSRRFANTFLNLPLPRRW
jgi:hypothetical protein